MHILSISEYWWLVAFQKIHNTSNLCYNRWKEKGVHPVELTLATEADGFPSSFVISCPHSLLLVLWFVSALWAYIIVKGIYGLYESHKYHQRRWKIVNGRLKWILFKRSLPNLKKSNTTTRYFEKKSVKKSVVQYCRQNKMVHFPVANDRFSIHNPERRFWPVADWVVGNSGECSKTRLHEVEEMIDSQYGELRNTYENYGFIRNLRPFFNVSVMRILEFMSRFSHNVPGPKDIAGPFLFLTLSNIQFCFKNHHFMTSFTRN